MPKVTANPTLARQPNPMAKKGRQRKDGSVYPKGGHIPPIAALVRGEQGTDQFRDSQHQRAENGCHRKAVAFIGYHGSQVRTVVGQAENDGDQRYILVPGVEHRQAQRAQGC